MVENHQAPKKKKGERLFHTSDGQNSQFEIAHGSRAEKGELVCKVAVNTNTNKVVGALERQYGSHWMCVMHENV